MDWLTKFFGFVDNFFWICRQDFWDLLINFSGLMTIFFGFVDNFFWICWQIFLDLSAKSFGFVDKIFWICRRNLLDLSKKSFGFVDEIFWICRRNLLDLSKKCFEFVGKICQRHYPMTASLHGSHGLSARRARRTKSRGPKGLQLEVGARRAPRLLVAHNTSTHRSNRVRKCDHIL